MAHLPLFELSEHQKTQLLRLARASIEEGYHSHCPLMPDATEFDDVLNAPGCCFVTLQLDGALRGCIGALEPFQSLVKDVSQHAFDAAYRDPRFESVTREQIPDLHISISVLTPSTAMKVQNEKDLLSQLQPGVDGLILEDSSSNRRATFLPSVWEQLPARQDFLAALKRKAHLPEDYWSSSLRFARYRTLSFAEKD